MEASTDAIRDGMDILVNLISDVLALKGRMIASFSANGLDSGASVFDGGGWPVNWLFYHLLEFTLNTYFSLHNLQMSAGLRIGGAVVQTAGDIGTAVSKGVGDVVQVVSDADVPPLPNLPNLPNVLGFLNLGNKNRDNDDDDFDSFEIGR